MDENRQLNSVQRPNRFHHHRFSNSRSRTFHSRPLNSHSNNKNSMAAVLAKQKVSDHRHQFNNSRFLRHR